MTRHTLARHEATTVAQAKAYVDKHYSEDLTLDDIAAALRYSRSHLSRLFTTITGVPLSSYLSRVRMDAAKKLLANTDLKIGGIVTRVGWSSAGTFCAAFRRAEKCSPSEYRRTCRQRVHADV